jgi:sugar/nucleoside kinase (ribokinase family)
MARGKLTAVGDMVCDLLCSPISHLGDEDVQITLEDLNLSPGGNTLNFAIAASSFGAEVTFHGAMGQDPLGSFLSRWLEKAKIRDHSKRLKGISTSTTVAIPNLSGERRLLTYPGANREFELDPEKVDIDGSAHVHYGGFFFTRKMANGGVRDLFEVCRQKGVETSLDPATDPGGYRGKLMDNFLEVLPLTDILMINVDELKGITGSRDITKGAKMLKEKGVGSVMVHRGDRGTAVIDDSGRKNYHPYPVYVPKNPTGCGDVFNGCFVASRLEDRDMDESVEMGMAAASLHLASAEPYYPHRERIMERVKRGK